MESLLGVQATGPSRLAGFESQPIGQASVLMLPHPRSRGVAVARVTGHSMRVDEK